MKTTPMTHPGFSIVRFAAVVALLCCSGRAQDQTVDPSYKKWLECDIEWIISDSTFVAGPEFSLKLSFQKEPLPTVHLILSHRWSPSPGFTKMGEVATAETDSQGVARFFGIPPGTYTVNSENGLLFPTGVDVRVRSRLGSGKQVAVEWPEQTIPVRALRGRFVTAEGHDKVAKPFPNVEIELLDLRTSRLIETIYTNADGRYEFSSQESGLYVLRVKPPIPEGKTEAESRDLAVWVDTAAKTSTIPELYVEQTDCLGVHLSRRVAKHYWTSPYSP
jgi:hypothetical protein